ncbi:MAG: exopolysaccharide biosynthesis protein [Chloroflexota bacterium]|nr:exopolysaccharide biosynthesis protein [Chloroflexota bacterium]MBI5703544.1 exopolysaccharide biosynthesis protein [Chloroflexota bacterium]
MEEHIYLTQAEEEELNAESLGEKIELIARKLPPHEVTLNEIMDIVGVDSLMLLTIFMSLIFLVPVSIPGVSTVFGTGILLFGVTHLFARKLWLPGFIAHRKLSAPKLREALGRALTWIHRLERISRPHRLPRLTNGRVVNTFNNLAFILAALLLMAPFGFIPFSNTLPALALIFLAIGMMDRDGGSILLGHLSNLATVIYFGFLIAGGGFSLVELLQRLQ